MSDPPSIYESEMAIRTLIKNDNNCEAFLHSFPLTNSTDSFELNLITMNPKHKTPFLLHSLQGSNLQSLYHQMYQYVFHLKKSFQQQGSKLLNYTVEWSDSQGTRQKSYFSGHSLQEILRKFNYGKSHPPTIFSLTLSPQT